MTLTYTSSLHNKTKEVCKQNITSPIDFPTILERPISEETLQKPWMLKVVYKLRLCNERVIQLANIDFFLR